MPAAQPGRRAARTRGFDPPLSYRQKLAWFTQGSSTLLFWGIVIPFVTKDPSTDLDDSIKLLLIVHTVCVVIGAANWLFLETHDPSVPSCFGSCLPKSERWTKVRYCAVHRTKIIGLDHHCTWLNTTVGRFNYVPFFILVVAGVVQFWTQVVGGFMLFPLSKRDAVEVKFDHKSSTTITYYTIIAVHQLAAGMVACCYSLLLTFHLYLFKIDQNTYDFLLERSKRLKAAKKAKSGSTSSLKKGAVGDDATMARESDGGGSMGLGVEQGGDLEAGKGQGSEAPAIAQVHNKLPPDDSDSHSLLRKSAGSAEFADDERPGRTL